MFSKMGVCNSTHYTMETFHKTEFGSKHIRIRFKKPIHHYYMIEYLRVIWRTPRTTSSESRFLSRSMTSHGKPNSKNIFNYYSQKFPRYKIYETKIGKYMET